MGTISTADRQYVRERANHRCEYCHSHQDYVFGKLQLDHIIPSVRGGSDVVDNLCLACEFCNQYKWTKVSEIDPQTMQEVSLFNPRQQNWSEHFKWANNGFEIVGLTACGRATVVALKLNNSLAVTVRKNWVKAGWHPPD